MATPTGHEDVPRLREGYFAAYAGAYDRVQTVHIEMYEFYHELALDFVPFHLANEFRILELGCGTGGKPVSGLSITSGTSGRNISSPRGSDARRPRQVGFQSLRSGGSAAQGA